jgi:hypothetical protein
MTRGLLPVLVLALLAGCFSTSPTDAPTTGPMGSIYDQVEQAIGEPIVAGHTHADATAHTHHHNLDRVALVNGHDGGAKPATEFYAETAVKGGYAYLCRYGPEAGLVIFDVHDVEHPKTVGFLHIEAGFEPDIEVSDDGKWAFWETQRFPLSAETPTTDPGANAMHGVHIIDVSDKAHPKWAGFSPTAPDGPHSITYANIGGRHILLQSVYAFAYAYANEDVPTTQRLVVSELDASGPAPTLKTLAEYRHPEAAGLGRMPHDVTVQKHPVTGRTLAYVAYWDLGMVILDLTDPARPTLVSTYADFGPAKYGAVHMVRSFAEPIAGKHVTVIEPEIGAEPDSGYLTFVDTTDPTHPTYLSSWRIPGNIPSDGGTLGPHYFDVSDGRIAMASYHAGFWIIDVHDAANLARPRSVGFSEVAAAGSAQVPVVGFGDADNAFDAWWYEGHVVGGDGNGGLAVYRYLGPTEHAA